MTSTALPSQGLAACGPPVHFNLPSIFHPLPHTYFPHTFMGAIDFFQSLTSFTAAFPVLLPNQSCHLCALLFLPSCQEFLRKLNNHADQLHYNLMISRVSWTQSCSAKAFTHSYLADLALSTPSLGAQPHPHRFHSPHRSPSPTENFQVISCETYPGPHLCLSIYLLICISLCIMGESWMLPQWELGNIVFYLCQNWASLYIPSLYYHQFW